MKQLVAILFLAFSISVQAKEKQAVDLTGLKHPVKPALWKVEGKDLKKPSYLFGTLHLGDPRVTTLHPDAEKAFTASDNFYAEIDLDPAKQMELVPKLMRKDGKTLSESIGPDLQKELNEALKAINPALDSKPFDPMKTWVISITLPILEIQLTGQKALDSVLYERAQADKKTVGALETADSQLKIFDDLKEQEQVSILKSTIAAMAKDKKEGKNPTQRLLNLYLTSNVTEIGQFVKETMEEGTFGNNELSKRLMKTLLDDRNISMAETIAKALAETPQNSHFFAVGAAHYTGATAIQDILTKKGYTITPAFK